MFSQLTNMLPSLSLADNRDNQATPTNAATVNPFDKLMAVKRRFEGARTTTPTTPTPAAPMTTEPQSGITTPAADTDAEQDVVREKERKRKPLNETFVVVRPPPSVSNHPLNLQLQLIPPKIEPQHQARSASTSTTGSSSSAGGGYGGVGGVPNVPPVSAGLQSRKEAAAAKADSPTDENELTRVRTNRSDLSQFYSSIGSSASVQSFSTMASTGTTTGSSRRIIPLYNLSAHNVLQNTVQDAGTFPVMFLVSPSAPGSLPALNFNLRLLTYAFSRRPRIRVARAIRRKKDSHDMVTPAPEDQPLSISAHRTDATVSRFRKRGIDIVGLGVLEPIEVWGNAPLGGPGGYTADDGVSDAGHTDDHHSNSHSPPKPISQLHSREGSAVGRRRRRQCAYHTQRNRHQEAVWQVVQEKRSLDAQYACCGYPGRVAQPAADSELGRPRTSDIGVFESIALDACDAHDSFHTRPALVFRFFVDVSASTGAWDASLASVGCGGGMFSNLASGGGLDMTRAGVEVRFEWVRGRKRRRDAQAQDPSRTVGTGRRIRGAPVSVASLGGAEGYDFSTAASESLAVPGPIGGRAPSIIASECSASPRRSIESKPRSRRGSSPAKRSARAASPTKKGTIGRNDSGSSRERDEEEEDSDPEDSETPDETPNDPALPTGLKLRLAHLVPAPHHPKVIGQFKMPFPLPDVSVSRMELVPRAPGDSFGLSGGDRQGIGRGEMVMTAEEIKDVVSTTGLWLMVREGYGGLGGKKRKGDGWKIRS
ncbi:hypothetical protein RhiLY_13095 [Ceratobasidium sp. AG-Ba]|nr:hypothetical protein RhiLY_13095 [Ceratobasidium sp. AG-Ba]